MEGRGLVERRREPDDRRVILVHTTEAGDAVFGEMAIERRKHLEPLLHRMTDDELESFLVGLRALRRVRSEAAEDPTGPEAATVIALFRQYLRPYAVQIAVVLVLLLIQALGNLYLPDLNADIIDNGVVKGDTDYILRVGVLMLGVTAVLGVAP